MHRISVLLLCALLAACSNFSDRQEENDSKPSVLASEEVERSTIWDALDPGQKSTQIKVNRYIWQASLEVLDFMPIQVVDPFSGVIAMGYGKPPGGKIEYQATVLVLDPALDARSLRISLRTRNGPAEIEIMQALEDAILSRARQIRVNDGRF